MVPDLVIGVFIWLLGLTVGSFLNVVLYRLPAGLSVGRPVRSFCPLCHVAIQWYDNLPLISWLLLRGRCRECRSPVSLQYPLVEAVSGLGFVLVFHLLFVSNARVGVSGPDWPTDIPLLLAWLFLVGALIACSGMDLVSYLVDTRITDVAMYAGFVLYALWPREALFARESESPLAAACLATAIVSGIMLAISTRRLNAQARAAEQEAANGTTELHDADESATACHGAAQNRDAPHEHTAGRSFAAGLVAVFLFLVLTAGLFIAMVPAPVPASRYAPAPTGIAAQARKYAVPAALFGLFATIVLVGGQRREVDEELHAAIEEEAPHARRIALRELLWLAGPLAAGVAAYLLVALVPGAARAWNHAVRWPEPSSFAVLGGVAYAVYGAMIAAAAGWGLRIVFTLVFGREAFGVGDIYILAAAGAAAGWDIALLGLLLSVGIAMAGWILSLMFKSSGMIPFGPWLALGFVTALWLDRPGTEIISSYARDARAAWETQPRLLAAGGGLMLIGTAFAVVLARLTRRLVSKE